ncbi:MAG: RecQ family ATP-dependent DNA helicase, partial [Acidimicrobiia bacterium]
YQISGQLIDGPTIVVSPLIALQRDQVEALNARIPGQAGEANSTVSVAELRERFAAYERGDLEYLFLAPEQLVREETIERLRGARPSLFVVDEAHCISAWGHDFRPEYLRLGAVVEELGRPTVLALTATAAPPVRAEICERLHLRDPEVVVRGFDRPNIRLSVKRFVEEDDKVRSLIECVGTSEGSGIVYVATRKRTQEIAHAFIEQGVIAVPYHAGLPPKSREVVHQQFMADDVQVVVATIAFGMGIDKPDVRFVHHLDISDSLDSYYQELGRAGRDGQPAEATLFFRQEDLGVRRFFAGGSGLERDRLVLLHKAIELGGPDLAVRELADELQLSEGMVRVALHRLADAGCIEMRPGDRVSVAEHDDLGAAIDAAVRAHEVEQQVEQSRVEMMRSYAEGTQCRRAMLLTYFGEPFDPPCGNCDNCEAGRSETADETSPFSAGSRVIHTAWGAGSVVRTEGDQLVVLFDDRGYKTLSIELVVEGDLLKTAG